MLRTQLAVHPLTWWSIATMAELRSLATLRKAKGRPGPTATDLDWVDRVLRRVGLPGLATPEAYLESGRDTRRCELIWPDPRVRVLLAPPFGLAGWPTGLAAYRLRRKLMRLRDDA